ncbi:hypothetical protein K6989_02630 [Mycoplasmopsis synoviae]|uniref:hypothetical protein n=1 Tax=Mycoplasmopsis synoviae TaxID=2109 RepID=UPI001CE0D3E9|nr:hypothetical protein [Mycoplasmopsis synoviae]UBX97258.1 hypothetical protein K6989_02630 [Mycoplasmopsis synoviae]
MLYNNNEVIQLIKESTLLSDDRSNLTNQYYKFNSKSKMNIENLLQEFDSQETLNNYILENKYINLPIEYKEIYDDLFSSNYKNVDLWFILLNNLLEKLHYEKNGYKNFLTPNQIKINIFNSNTLTRFFFDLFVIMVTTYIVGTFIWNFISIK